MFSPPGGALPPIIGGLAIVPGVLALDRALGDRGLLHERPPDWSPIYQLRTLLLALASALLVVGARRLADARLPAQRAEVGLRVVVAGVAGAVVSVAAAALVVFDPDRLTSLAVEDGPVEWLTAALAFLAALVIAVALTRFVRANPRRVSRSALVVVAGAAVGSLLIGLEEVSWFQRVVGFGSPEVFEGRNQAEFNLHNAATGLSENVYYGVSFLSLVAVPALLAGRSLPASLSGLEPVVPGRAVMYGSIPAGALIYEMWEIVPMQIVLFASLGFLLTDGARFRAWRLGPPMAIVLIAVVVALQVFGDGMSRSWDNTEVRELLPPFGLTLYGMGLLGRATSAGNASGPVTGVEGRMTS